MGVGILLDQARRHAVGPCRPTARDRRPWRGQTPRRRPWPPPRRERSADRGHRHGPRRTTRRPGGRPAPAFTSHGLAAVANSKKAEVMAAMLSSKPARSTSPTARRSAKPALLITASSWPKAATVSSISRARGAGLGEIALDDQRLPAALAHDLGDLLGALTVLAGMERDGGVGGGESASGGGADAGGGTGDQEWHGVMKPDLSSAASSRTVGARSSAKRREPRCEKWPWSTKSTAAKEAESMPI